MEPSLVQSVFQGDGRRCLRIGRVEQTRQQPQQERNSSYPQNPSHKLVVRNWGLGRWETAMPPKGVEYR